MIFINSIRQIYNNTTFGIQKYSFRLLILLANNRLINSVA